ncbi:MAG TPA: alpha/beta fold hydrolase [Actinomycetota bacterium]
MRVEANGLSFEVLDEGPKDKDAVLLLHGFPDTHAMWRHQIPALTAAGYRCIAPDLRGRGATEKPQLVEEYFAPVLLADATGLLDALKTGRVHVVGHDWGAVVAWLLASFAPERIASLTAISVGHPASWAWPSLEQRRRSWYMPFFHLPGAERALRHDDWRLLREWTQNHPETSQYIATLTPDGALTAALNWYRANAVGGWFADPVPYPPVQAPTMGIFSSGDIHLTDDQMLASREFVAGEWRYEHIDGASHWIPLDAPDRVSELLLSHLAE